MPSDPIKTYYPQGYGRDYEITVERKKGGFTPESVSDEAKASGEIRRRIEDVRQGLDLENEAMREVWE